MDQPWYFGPAMPCHAVVDLSSPTGVAGNLLAWPKARKVSGLDHWPPYKDHVRSRIFLKPHLAEPDETPHIQYVFKATPSVVDSCGGAESRIQQ